MPGPLSRTQNFTSGAVLSMLSTFSSRSCGPSWNEARFERLAQNLAADFNAMAQRRALKGVDGKVQQNLDDVGSVHLDAGVLGHRL